MLRMFRRGILEVGAIALFAALVGTFLMSTIARHTGSGAQGGFGLDQNSSESVPAIDRSRIRVEVRNGSGASGAAGKVTTFLRDEGFDVVDYGNADRFDYERTHIIDRVGSSTAAREVATLLPGVPIEASPDSTLFLDVTIVIGHDLESVLLRSRNEASDRGSGWRRWLDRLTGG